MPEELPDLLTVATPLEIADGLVRAWRHLFSETPTKRSIYVLLAQGALETGWWHSCHCWNLGNAKSREGDGHDWTYFKCEENLDLKTAQQLVKEDPAHVRVSGTQGSIAYTWFSPPHRFCRFRAFRTLDEGALDYLGMLHNRFARAWPDVLLGNPAGFAHQLKLAHYYTASEADYTANLDSIYVHSIPKRMPPDWEPLAVELEHPLITDEDRRRIQGLIALTAAQMVNEAFEEPDKEPSA